MSKLWLAEGTLSLDVVIMSDEAPTESQIIEALHAELDNFVTLPFYCIGSSEMREETDIPKSWRNAIPYTVDGNEVDQSVIMIMKNNKAQEEEEKAKAEAEARQVKFDF